MAHFLSFFANEKEYLSTMGSTLQSLPCKPRFPKGCEYSLFQTSSTGLVSYEAFYLQKNNLNMWGIDSLLLRGVSAGFILGNFFSCAVALYGKKFVEGSLKCFCKVFWKSERELKVYLLKHW